MIQNGVRVLRGAANLLEAYGAERELRDAPANLPEAYDFAAGFRYGAIALAPLQVREEMEALLAKLGDHPPRIVLEIGTAGGGSLFLLSRAARPDAIIVSVDMDGGTSFPYGYPRSRQRLYRSFAKAGQTISLIRGDSHLQETFSRIQRALRGPVDLLFIDGDHSYEGVAADFYDYSSLVRSGGLVVFHDIVEGPHDAVGDVPRFWRDIRDETAEEIVADEDQGGYGIGILCKH